MPISKIKSSAIDPNAITGSAIADGTVDTADLATGAVTSAKLDTNIGIGTVNAPSNKNTVTPTLNVLGSGVNGAAQITRHTSVGGGGALIHLAATRGNDVNSYTILQSGDGIGTVAFQAADGNEFVTAAQIVANVDGTPGDNDMPARLSFSVTEDGNSFPTERMRIHNGGVVSFSNGIELGSGLDATAANVLDDYEEGTWTPSLVGLSSESGQSYATQEGDYTKIGNQVFCRFGITMSAAGSFSGGYILLSGLPFTIENTPATVHLGQNIISLGLQGRENDNKAYLWIKTTTSASREYPNTATIIGNTTQLTGSFTFQTTA